MILNSVPATALRSFGRVIVLEFGLIAPITVSRRRASSSVFVGEVNHVYVSSTTGAERPSQTNLRASYWAAPAPSACSIARACDEIASALPSCGALLYSQLAIVMLAAPSILTAT